MCVALSSGFWEGDPGARVEVTEQWKGGRKIVLLLVVATEQMQQTIAAAVVSINAGQMVDFIGPYRPTLFMCQSISQPKQLPPSGPNSPALERFTLIRSRTPSQLRTTQRLLTFWLRILPKLMISRHRRIVARSAYVVESLTVDR